MKNQTINHYPEPGKYLSFLKLAYAHLNKGANYTIKIHWTGDELNLEQFQKECLNGLHHRINAKGACPTQRYPQGQLSTDEYREEKYRMLKDRDRIEAWLHQPWNQRKTNFGLGLETNYFRRRYPDVDVEMRTEMFQRY